MTNSSAAATHANAMPASMTAAAPAATVLPNMTLQPNVTLQPNTQFRKVAQRKTGHRESGRQDPERETARQGADRFGADDQPAVERRDAAVAFGPVGGRGAVEQHRSTSTSRVNLRVVTTPPLAASLPAAAPMMAKLADAPLQPTPTITARIADLPMQPPVAPPAAPTPVAPVMPAAAPTPRHEEHNFRVLAVDDSPLMRTFLQNKLAPYGIHPEFAASGEEALFKISKQHYDLIFLDVMLPGMDGYDVCKMIKKNKDNALMKVVMLTSKDKTFDKIRGTMAGCDGYLTKPVDEMKLRAIIERHSVAQEVSDRDEAT